MLELSKVDPSTLTAVLPQLEFKLKVCVGVGGWVCLRVWVCDFVLSTNMASTMTMNPDFKCTQSSVVNSVQLTQPFFKQNVIPCASASAVLCDNHLPTWVPQSAFCRKCWKAMSLLEMSIVFEQPPIPVLYVVQPKRTENSGLVVPTQYLPRQLLSCRLYCNTTFWLYSRLLCREERLVPMFRCMPSLIP